MQATDLKASNFAGEVAKLKKLINKKNKKKINMFSFYSPKM